MRWRAISLVLMELMTFLISILIFMKVPKQEDIYYDVIQYLTLKKKYYYFVKFIRYNEDENL